jgi:hypothetical protein
MLTVHKMPPKNQCLTGISSGYDKTQNQNKLQPFTIHSFTSDCPFVDCGNESYSRNTTISTRAEIHYFTTTKQKDMLMHCFGDLNSIYSNFETETAKSGNFIIIFTSYKQPNK